MKSILKIIGGMFCLLFVSCAMEIQTPVHGLGVQVSPPVQQFGGPQYGGQPQFGGPQYRAPQYGGQPQYGGPNGAGQIIYHGSQAQHVYDNGPQSYAESVPPAQIFYQPQR